MIDSHNNLYSQIISLENLFASYREFRRGKRHRPEVAEFEINLEENIFSLRQELANGTYQHGPYFHFKISDPKPRLIHKAGVKDRIVHQAIYRVLYSIVNRNFIHDSYSSRLGKGVHQAVKQLESFVRSVSANYQKPCFALKLDIRKFFDSIDQVILFALIRQKIHCAPTLGLIKKIIGSFQTQNGQGLPLGNVTSQLFANVYLHELDRFVKHNLKEKYYLRFCDDFMLIKTKKDFSQDLKLITNFLHQHLRLQLKDDKLKIAKQSLSRKFFTKIIAKQSLSRNFSRNIRKLRWGFDFLGKVILPHHLVLRPKTKKRMIYNLNCKKSYRDNGKINQEKFDQTLQSYLGQLKYLNGYLLSQVLKEKYGNRAD